MYFSSKDFRASQKYIPDGNCGCKGRLIRGHACRINHLDLSVDLYYAVSRSGIVARKDRHYILYLSRNCLHSRRGRISKRRFHDDYERASGAERVPSQRAQRYPLISLRTQKADLEHCPRLRLQRELRKTKKKRGKKIRVYVS